MTKNKILIVGSCNTDMVIKTERFPLPGETIIGGEFFMNPGGKGANQAMAAKRLGGEVIFIGKIGEDIFGQNSLNLMKSEGIDIRYLGKDSEMPSGVALITVDSTGENSIVVAPGSNGKLTPADFDRALSELDEVAVILLQLEIPLETVEHIVRIASKNDIRIVLNPAPGRDLPDTMLKDISAITPNETEAEILTGVKVVDIDTAKKASEILRSRGVREVIITMGAEGAFVLSDSYNGMVRTPSVEVQDTTAAGDTFNGALAVGLAEKKSLHEAVELACKVASLSVTRMGAQSSIPYREELNQLEKL
ncbi:ribokinase [Arenibacter palladensis]|uniref:ribokinase n=1 Tax=Arenibacter palladensis TaxID=237373 RepID=UPI002FD03751